MTRIIYRILPFAVIAFFLYMGSDWAEEVIYQTKQIIEVEKTKWEMDSIGAQLKFSLSYRPDEVHNFDYFLEKMDSDNWEELRSDEWGTEYWYEYSANEERFTIQSAGPDQEFYTDDDIIVTNRKRR